MELVQLLESSALLVPEWHELKPYPAPPATQAAWRTDVLTTLQVGPVDLLADDVLDVRLEHEFDAERQDGGPLPGASAYTVGGQQSEHWFLYVMASTSARLRAGGQVVATDVLRTKETNWDNLIHHLAVCRAGFWRVPQDFPAALVQDRVYFKSGLSYTMPEAENRQVQINSGVYPKLSVAVFRAAA